MSERFGRYELSRLAGSGGMAQVHVARLLGPQGVVKPCVLKRIAPGFARDPEIRRMFLEEARISALLNHPHIVQTFDYGEQDGAPYMAMELVDGVNLSQLCRTLAAKDRWLPLRSSVEICIAVAEALAYAHGLTDLDGRGLNLVHRDVSPQNILVSRQGGVKLADFGIARHDAREQVTQTPQAKGKPGYMAPEQAMAEGVDGRTDLFALGIVLTELMSARRVSRSTNAVVSLRGMTARVAELVELRQDAPEELKQVAYRLTAIEPSDRPRTAREAAELLRIAASKIPEKISLSVFLERVFERYLPAEEPGANVGGTPSPSALPSVDPRRTNLSARTPSATPLPEIESTLVTPDGGPASEDWAKQERAVAGAAAVYESAPGPVGPFGVNDSSRSAAAREDSGPTRIRGQAPSERSPLDLVARSSSVEAMQYFGAQGSSSTSPRGARRGPTQVDAARGEPARAEGGGEVGPGEPEDRTLLVPERPQPGAPRIDPPAYRRYLAPVGVALVIGALGFAAVVALAPKPHEPPPVALGSLHVTSTPPGAAVLLDGQRTGQVTPYELSGPVGKAYRVAVALPGHRASPAEVQVVLKESTLGTQASFKLDPGRSFRLETTPASATVTFNGGRLSEPTPLDLPVIPLGETATLAIALEGHLQKTLRLAAKVETATVVDVKLEPARQIDVLSEPPGAEVFVDNTSAGKTPVYDVQVPELRPFRVRVEKKGYKPWRQQLVAKGMKGKAVEAGLEMLPLLSMPMSKEERDEAREYDKRSLRLGSELRLLKAKIVRLEKTLAEIESEPNVLISRVTDAQSAVDDAKRKAEELENERAELDQQMDAFRARVMSKLEGN